MPATTAPNPVVSVVIPVYNAGHGLLDCIQSIQRQTFADFELVAVDDASADDSAAILAKYGRSDSRIRPVTHPANRGSLAARLTGIREARGEFITFVDADDSLEPDALELAVQKARATGADLVHFGVKAVGPLAPAFRREWEKRNRPHSAPLHGEQVFDGFFRDRLFSWSIWGKLFRADLCRRGAELIPPDYCVVAEDFSMFTAIAGYAQHYEPLFRPGYRYTLCAGISSYAKSDLPAFRRHCTAFTACREVRACLEKRGVFDRCCDAFRLREYEVIADLLHRWRYNLAAADRDAAFALLFQEYDPPTLYRAFRRFFASNNRQPAELLARSGLLPLPPGPVLRLGWLGPGLERFEAALREAGIAAEPCTPESVQNGSFDAVCHAVPDTPEFFWEMLAIKTAGCRFVPLLSERFDAGLARDLHVWQMRDLTLRQSDGRLAADPVSAAWFTAAGVRCESSGDASALLRLLRRMEDPAPETDAVAESLSGALAGYFESHRDHYLAPSPEGESFLPFYRKVDKVLTGLMPWGSRRRRVIAGTLARWYNQLTHNN